MASKERHAEHKGGILADDMGLGKTIQTIALMLRNVPKGESEHTRGALRTLVVAPVRFSHVCVFYNVFFDTIIYV